MPLLHVRHTTEQELFPAASDSVIAPIYFENFWTTFIS
jgi:hypothetical protein